MWVAIFGYPDSPVTALVERLVVLLLVVPWLILMVRSAPGPASRYITAARLALMLYLLDRMMVDLQMWGPIALVVSALWATRFTRRLAWLAAGILLTALQTNFGPIAPILYISLFFVAVGLLTSGPRHRSAPADPPSSDQAAPVTERSRWPAGRWALSAAAALPLYWSAQGLTQEHFARLLLAGMAGWFGVQFVCWKAGRISRGWSLRVAAATCGVIASLLALLLAGEVYFRHIYDASDANGELRTSRRWGQRHVRFNSWGYRDREIPPPEKLDELTRVVLLGDSFAYGWGIAELSDLLGPQLERALVGRVTPAPRVFMLAFGGIDTRREMSLFAEHGVLLRPRVVVLMYHLNDTDTLVPRPRIPRIASATLRPLTDSSDCLEFLLWQASLRRAAAGWTIRDLPGINVYQDATLFARQSNDLLALMSLIREHGAKPIVVLYPYLSAPTQEGPQREALDKVTALLAQAQVPVVDVSRIVDVTDRRYHANPFDPHPSPALHAAIAPILAGKVLGLLNDPPASAAAP